MNSLFISFAYETFYNKISGTSMNQWIPEHLHTCCQLIYNALSDSAIKEVEFVNSLTAIDAHERQLFIELLW